jgi:hypothetical protein
MTSRSCRKSFKLIDKFEPFTEPDIDTITLIKERVRERFTDKIQHKNKCKQIREKVEKGSSKVSLYVIKSVMEVHFGDLLLNTIIISYLRSNFQNIERPP